MADMKEIKDMLDRMTMEMANFTVRQNQIEAHHEKAFSELKQTLDAVKEKDKGKTVEEVDGAGGNPNMVTPGGYQMGMGSLHQLQSPIGGAMPQNQGMGFRFTGQDSQGRAQHQIPTSGGHGQAQMGYQGGFQQATGHFMSNMSRLSKIEFPRFNGSDLRSWLCKVDQFFSLDEIPYNQKVKIASLHFDGLSIECHLAYLRSRQHLPYPTWEEYLFALTDRFGAEFEDPMAELKLVKQTGNVKDYQNEFDKIMTRLTILPEYAISGFITGLKPEIGYTVKNHKPLSLPQAYQLARNTEAQVHAQLKLTRHPSYGGSNFQNKGGSFSSFPRGATNKRDVGPTKRDTSVNLNRSNSKRLTPAEMNERRQKGLCFFCDEKFFPGHKCGSSKSLYLLEVEEEIEEDKEEGLEEPIIDVDAEEEQGEVCEISVHALHGIPTFNTLRVEGCCRKRTLHILIDPGSSHNFMDEELAKELRCDIQIVKPHAINVADGHDRQTNEICKAFSWELTLGYHYKGQECILEGSVDKVRTVQAKRLDKLSKAGGQLFMIRVMPVEEEREEWDMSIPLAIQSLSKEYPQLFVDPKGLPPSRGPFDHRIPLEADSNPINMRPYRYSSTQKDVIEKLVQDMLEQGIIQPSFSPYASPVVLVGKKDGSWRLCVDYRGLNKVTIKDKFPIPIIEELLEELGGSQIYSKIDLKSGYHQIRMAKEDIIKTAFKTHEGHYEYLVMPFGLTNAPSSFQSLMNHVFKEHHRKFILVFFDDILVFSKSLSEHLEHLKITFELLVKHKLCIRQSKCSFGASKVEYLGHVISAEGVATDPKKIEAVKAWPSPKNVKEMRGFLGLTGYYRRFIRHYGVISKPLTDLLKKEGFQWSDKATQAFEKLKEALVSAPVLVLPNNSSVFIVETDACDYGIGAVLMQESHPIAYLSKGLSIRHQGLSVYDKELLALVMAVTKWAQYLIGRKFIVRTDQKALKFLLDQKLHTGAQMKWIAKLMQFHFEIEYKKGRENKAADSLSRVQLGEVSVMMITPVVTELFEKIKTTWETDPVLQEILTKINDPNDGVKGFSFINQQLRRKGKLVVGNDSSVQQEII
ncbi:uncharacterized protein [Solanum tuberosum]|uniref:uncharacterized protein n=1 Tax=Solanum tuberosum TaxID=4113 RepID=UPI00073A3F83|nr:PREDICTED: uncharacterized protein LOC107059372 [Solanum tuberosum]